MSDFIKVTSLDIKARKTLININHISDIQEDDKGEVRIYLADGITSYPVKETFDEIVDKIKNAEFNRALEKASMDLYERTKHYEEQTQNQGYTLV